MHRSSITPASGPTKRHLRKPSMVAMGLAAALLLFSACGGGKPASTPSPETATPGTQVAGPPSSPTSGPPSCPVLPDICASAAKAEQQLLARDYAAIAESRPAIEGSLRNLATTALGQAKPRLVSIGCPFGAVSSSCESSFALAFTTLAPFDDWTGATSILLLRYDRRPAGATLAAVSTPVEREARRAVLAGGMAVTPCGLAGQAADQSPGNCSRAEFFPYWTSAPFIPAEATPNPFKVEPQAQPPVDSLMYISTGCWGCEGFDTGLQRVLTSKDGKTTLEAVAKPTLLPREVVTQYIAAPNASLIVATTCSGTSCGPLGPGSADLRGRVLISRDGGFTWSELASYQGTVYAYDVGNDGRILVGRSSGPGAPETWQRSWELLPGPQQLIPPSNAGDDAYARLAPGDVIWLSSSTGVISNQPQYRLPMTAADHLIEIVPLDSRRTIAIWYSGPNFQPPRHWYAGLFDDSGRLQWKREFDTNAQFSIKGLVSGSLLFGNSQAPSDQPYGQLPAFVDIDSGTIRTLGAPFGQAPLVGRNRFLAYRAGPFARVTGAGDCLNVRESPSTTARVVSCYVDGVLMSDLGDTTTAENVTWLHVRTPGGEPGWASTQYLSR